MFVAATTMNITTSSNHHRRWHPREMQKSMLYDSIVGRSFSKHEQKNFGYGALLGCFFIAFIFCIIFKPFLGPLPDLNLSASVASIGHKMLTVKDASSQQILEVAEVVRKKMEPPCFFQERTDYCHSRGDVRVDGGTSSVFFASTSKDMLEGNTSWNIKPYARKSDSTAMGLVREWSVKLASKMPECTRNHRVPAVLFSTGGYAGNHFHDFTDVAIPLFITSRSFNGEVQFLISDDHFWWVSKFEEILKTLSKYEPIFIDKDKHVHCFPSVIVGLKRNEKDLTIDPVEHSHTMTEFREFLRSSYSLKRAKAIQLEHEQNRKPRPQLLIVSRRKTRAFTNARKLTKAARRLGFEVIVTELDMRMARIAETVNSCDVMLGIHGAGLTNMLFLPENSVMVQIVPFGGIEWVAQNFFGEPSKDMKIKYLEYKISISESTLIRQYPTDDIVLRDPSAIKRRGWPAFSKVYLENQNVSLNIRRCRPTLEKALEFLRQKAKSELR